MKFYDTHFEDYLASYQRSSLHPDMSKIYKSFPKHLSALNNLILYGPSGVGKYTQMLAAIRSYSPSDLKYEKKLSINYNKNTYFFKISDVHFEVDMGLLGCHSKLLWNEIYTQIVDIIMAKADNTGIIVCKNFHEIHSELLDTFYSYMQSFNTSNVNVKFILLTEEISFIPDNIFHACLLLKYPRPAKELYELCLQMPMPKDLSTPDVTNIKNLSAEISQLMRPHEVICGLILEQITNANTISFARLRDQLYDIFIYNLNVLECVWFILAKLIQTQQLAEHCVPKVLMKTYSFLKYYNNNYRPIYHLEHYILYLIQTVHNMPVEQ
jgi:hypothetical protein